MASHRHPLSAVPADTIPKPEIAGSDATRCNRPGASPRSNGAALRANPPKPLLPTRARDRHRPGLFLRGGPLGRLAEQRRATHVPVRGADPASRACPGYRDWVHRAPVRNRPAFPAPGDQWTRRKDRQTASRNRRMAGLGCRHRYQNRYFPVLPGPRRHRSVPRSFRETGPPEEYRQAEIVPHRPAVD
jgi:hypothetical protein